MKKKTQQTSRFAWEKKPGVSEKVEREHIMVHNFRLQ